METHGFLFSTFIFLAAAVISVPISKKLGFGSVLGYLIAGLTIGPWGLKLITNVEDIMHFSEFGVVLLLFLIGMELEPKKLWAMRLPIFGMGGIQVIACTIVITGIGKLLGFETYISLLAGMGFSLSSTAIVLQILNEKKMLSSTSGSSAFSILLFQDIAVIAMIAMLPFLAASDPTKANANADNAWLSFATAIGVLVFVGIVGKILVRYVLKMIAGLHLREIFTAFALLLIVAISALMQYLNISMALGAFLAGVLLAESEYRHALEADIEPFKGLLLGLFFMSVGMSVDLESILQNPGMIFGLTFAVMFVKFTMHAIIGKVFFLPKGQTPFFALVLAQVGEFAFVLFGAAKALGVIDELSSGILIAVTAISMLLTPLFIMLFEKLDPFLSKCLPKIPQDTIANEKNPVIIAGFGRFGQIIGRLLFANKIKATVLDFEPDQIELLKKFGFKVYYGDATRMDLLESAGANQAKILVIAIDNVESSLKLVDIAQKHFPHLKIFVRARNLGHMYDLLDRNVTNIERELFESSLKMGGSVLHELGLPASQTQAVVNRFRELNIQIIHELRPVRNNDKEMFSKARQAREDLSKMFEEEADILQDKALNPTH